MNAQLTPVEIQELQQLLPNDTPAQQALTTLQQHNGNLESTFDALWQEKVGKTDYSKGKKSLLSNYAKLITVIASVAFAERLLELQSQLLRLLHFASLHSQ